VRVSFPSGAAWGSPFWLGLRLREREPDRRRLRLDEYERLLLAADEHAGFLDERAHEAVERRLAEARNALKSKEAVARFAPASATKRAADGKKGHGKLVTTNHDKWYEFAWFGKLFEQEDVQVGFCCTARPKAKGARTEVRFSRVEVTRDEIEKTADGDVVKETTHTL